MILALLLGSCASSDIKIEDGSVTVGEYDKVVSRIDGPYEVYDLAGKTMLPGFVDAHTHVLNGALLASIAEYVGMSKFRTTAEVIESLKEFETTLEPGEWLVAGGWDPSIMEGPAELTMKDLDEISSDRAVFVLNASRHLAYANTMAFELAGIYDSVVNPHGAEFVRDENGSINGVMKNNMVYLQVLGANPVMAEANMVQAVLDLLKDFSANGLTTATEQLLGAVTGSRMDMDLLLMAAQDPDFAVRVMAYPGYTIEKSLSETPVLLGEGNDLVRAVGFKLVADGSNQGYTGLQRDLYPGTCNLGLEYQSVDELVDFITRKTAEGWQRSIHGNGDRAIDNILEALERAKEQGVDYSQLRPRIEHTSILHDEQIAKMKELGVSASFLIGHVHYWGVDFRYTIFGEEKAWMLDRAKSVEDAGISYTLHSDYPVTEADPLQMVYSAVTRETWKESDYVLNPAERVSVESALRSVTIEAAWQTMCDDKVGSLEEGKLADMVILDRNPLEVNPSEINTIEVMETWMDGKRVYLNN